MKRITYKLSLVWFGLILCACNQGSVDTIASNMVVNSQIYQDYYVEGSKSSTIVVATFRVGGATGTTLDLSEPGKILYNGAPLEKSAPANLIGTNHRTKGTDYRAYLKNYSAAHNFEFTDNEGKTSTSSVNLPPLEISANGSLSLTASEPTTIPLSRTVGADEKLGIGINTSVDEAISTTNGAVYLNAARNAVVITPNYWQSKQLKTKAEIQIKVRKSVTIAQGSNLGGAVSISYAAAPVYVSVSNSAKAVNADSKSVNANIKTANVNAANVKPANTTANVKTVSANAVAAKPTVNANANK